MIAGGVVCRTLIVGGQEHGKSGDVRAGVAGRGRLPAAGARKAAVMEPGLGADGIAVLVASVITVVHVVVYVARGVIGLLVEWWRG